MWPNSQETADLVKFIFSAVYFKGQKCLLAHYSNVSFSTYWDRTWNLIFILVVDVTFKNSWSNFQLLAKSFCQVFEFFLL